MSALLLFCREVIGRPLGYLGLVQRAHVPARVPVVLTRGEVHRVLEELEGIHQLVGMLLYGAGAPVVGGAHHPIKDLGFARGEVTIRRGKGAQDRATVLPERLRDPLAAHLESGNALHQKDLAIGAGRVLLPEALARKYPAVGLSRGATLPGGRHGTLAPSSSTPDRGPAGDDLRRPCGGTPKRASCHSFRHSFATHLLEAGYDIRTAQELLVGLQLK